MKFNKKSIRRSLITYFLVLLAVALGAACGLMYQTTYQTLQAKQLTAGQLRQEQYDEQWRKELHRRDLDLLSQARALAGITQSQVQWSRMRNLAFSQLGILSAAPGQYGYAPIALYLAQSGRSPFSHRMYRMLATDIQLNEDFLPHDAGSASHEEYYQVTTEWGNLWRSRSLGEQTLPSSFPELAASSLFDWQFDDVQLRPGLEVRRVVLKAPLTKFRFPWPQRPPEMPGPPNPRDRDLRRGPPAGLPLPPSSLTVPAVSRNDESQRVTESALPTIFVQCAWDAAPFDEKIAELVAHRDADLAAFAEETQRTLDRLRKRIWLVGLLTFATVVVGGTLLIRSGLLPLRRLSDAVSQVSEKDFRLDVDRDQMPRELVPIVDRLSHVLKMLGRAFEREKQSVADISHELRTPLASLLTTLDVSLRKPRSAEQYRETMQDCRLIAKQMSQLVERIMALACLDANTVRWDRQFVDVGEMVDACATMVRPLAEANGVTISVRHDPTLRIHTDPDKLREILVNLLHNAVEYNRPGGSVELVGAVSGGGVQMEVRDTGIGIPVEARERIFERFVREDASRHATGIHAGLGLAIVKEYIARLGGSIAVESVVGVGSTFRVNLPDRAEESQQGGAQPCE